MVPIRLMLLNTWGKHTLDDLTKLVGLLGVPGTHLHLSRVEEGCIAVTWLCSTSDVRELKQAIDQAAGSLQVVGVLQVFTGEEMILDCRHQPDQPQGPCLTKIYFTITHSSILFTCMHYMMQRYYHHLLCLLLLRQRSSILQKWYDARNIKWIISVSSIILSCLHCDTEL